MTLLKFREKASLRKVFFTAIPFLLIYILINGSFIGTAKLLKITDGINILDFEFGYSVEKAYDILSKLGVDGRKFYLSPILIPLDFIFPFTYMLFYTFLIAYLLKLMKTKYNKLNYIMVIPVFGMLCDWKENLLIISMLNSYPNQLSSVCKIASTATILKFIFNISSMILIAILIIINIIFAFRRHNK